MEDPHNTRFTIKRIQLNMNTSGLILLMNSSHIHARIEEHGGDSTITVKPESLQAGRP